jgi:hypothetical protein
MADKTNMKKLTYDDYTVGIICPLEVEMTVLRYMLDEEQAWVIDFHGQKDSHVNVEISSSPPIENAGRQNMAVYSAPCTYMHLSF